MGFGEYIKEKRLARKLTLREFSEASGFDAGNVSKLERGVLPAPRSEEKLKRYAKALGLRPGEMTEFLDLAAVSRKSFTVQHVTDPGALERLPMLFRALDHKGLTGEKIERILALIRKETGK